MDILQDVNALLQPGQETLAPRYVHWSFCYAGARALTGDMPYLVHLDKVLHSVLQTRQHITEKTDALESATLRIFTLLPHMDMELVSQELCRQLADVLVQQCALVKQGGFTRSAVISHWLCTQLLHCPQGTKTHS